MMYSYGITQIGPYHIQKGTVCQDSHYIKKISENCVIAAAADGLGSETHSDIASAIAAKEAVLYCADNLPEKLDETSSRELICRSFFYALQMITNEAARENQDINQFDTTLTLGIYIDDTVYFGQSGDSGAIVLCTDGHYEGITSQQRDESGCVFPLAFGEDKWVFGTKKGVASLLLATDGMLEVFYPVLLHAEKVNIYIALAQFFMDEGVLKFSELGEDGVFEKMNAFVKSIPENQVNDDKTVVVVVNNSVKCGVMEDDYYKVPDWAALQKKRAEEFKRLAYPHLYPKEKELEPEKEGDDGKDLQTTVQSKETENTSSKPKETESPITEQKTELGKEGSETSKKEGISGIFKQITSALKSKSKKE